jgi:hypothetical protein
MEKGFSLVGKPKNHPLYETNPDEVPVINFLTEEEVKPKDDDDLRYEPDDDEIEEKLNHAVDFGVN